MSRENKLIGCSVPRGWLQRDHIDRIIMTHGNTILETFTIDATHMHCEGHLGTYILTR
jgi:hypothetical protein